MIKSYLVEGKIKLNDEIIVNVKEEIFGEDKKQAQNRVFNRILREHKGEGYWLYEPEIKEIENGFRIT